MTKVDILEMLNTLIIEEGGNAVMLDDLLVECGLDSFSYCSLFLGIEDYIEKTVGVEVFDSYSISRIQPTKLLVSSFVDKIHTEVSNGN